MSRPNGSRLRDPQALPVSQTDAHLPAVPADALQLDALRRRFQDHGAAPERFVPEHAGDGLLWARDPARAAVLIALLPHASGLSVLLTQRAATLRDHAGQIAFPGGRIEAGDADEAAAALREAEEEIGLDPRQVEVLGPLPPYTTVTHFVVTPVVAVLAQRPQLRLDEGEVAAAFEVPLPWLMNPAHHQRRHYELDGVSRSFLAMPYEGPALVGPPPSGPWFIWGATAAMLRNLYSFLRSP